MSRHRLNATALTLVALVVGCASEVVVERREKQNGRRRCHAGYELVDGACRIREIPFAGGSFMMGRGYCYPAKEHAAEFADGRCSLSDEPHLVSVGPFAMHAVTPSLAEGDRDEGFLADDCPGLFLDCVPPDLWRPLPAYLPEGPEHFCARRGMTPATEAQWEYAASLGGTRTYPWGEDPPTCERIGIANRCPPDSDELATFPPSPEGLYNLAGASAEMVLYDERFAIPGYPDTPGVFDPLCDHDPCKRLITRGGDLARDIYPNTFAELRAAHRGKRDRGAFRCVRNL